MKQGTIRGYIVAIHVLGGSEVRTVEGFGSTPKKALTDAKDKLTKEELMFGYLRIDEPRKVKASFSVPLADILQLKTCAVSGWTYED